MEKKAKHNVVVQNSDNCCSKKKNGKSKIILPVHDVIDM